MNALRKAALWLLAPGFTHLPRTGRARRAAPFLALTWLLRALFGALLAWSAIEGFWLLVVACTWMIVTSTYLQGRFGDILSDVPDVSQARRLRIDFGPSFWRFAAATLLWPPFAWKTPRRSHEAPLCGNLRLIGLASVAVFAIAVGIFSNRWGFAALALAPLMLYERLWSVLHIYLRVAMSVGLWWAVGVTASGGEWALAAVIAAPAVFVTLNTVLLIWARYMVLSAEETTQ